ncbi:MAG: hypothetical protein JSV23_07035 [Promethearchaeota archaeon]|nr:MAG: hypothetical protein JSV23_07035 [Candidatus Lokiarchaeota archaeon]
MDWSNFLESIGAWINIFIEWYLVQPLYGQILVLIGVIALLALVITFVYYIIKGIAYLVYYIIKGIYYLLKGIGYGFFKLFEGFYFLVSGKSKSSKQKNFQTSIQDNSANDYQVIIEFCSECGRKFSEKMKMNLEKIGMAFCVNCGKEFRLNYALKPLTLSH